MAYESGKIRNVAIVGHRGTGKTSLVEAMLFQGGATTRLGTVEQASTVSDWEEEEHKRQMSLSGRLCHLEWQGRKLNLIDTPGDAGFQADAIAALRVVEGAVLVVNAVAGVEVQTTRLWHRCEELELSRVIFVNMLDRERADFFAALEQMRSQLSDRCVAIEIPIGQEHELKGVVDLLHMKAYMDPGGEREGAQTEIPEEIAEQAQAYRTQLIDAVVETDEAVMERYLEGEEIGGEELAAALKNAVSRDELFPVACGVGDEEPRDGRAPRPDRRGRPVPGEEAAQGRGARQRRLRVRLQDGRRPVRRADHDLPRALGRGRRRRDARQLAHARQGAPRPGAHAPGQGSRARRTPPSPPATSARWRS